MIVLNDSGANQNFIRQKMVDHLRLPIIKGTKFGVTIGDGTAVVRPGICKNWGEFTKIHHLERFLSN